MQRPNKKQSSHPSTKAGTRPVQFVPAAAEPEFQGIDDDIYGSICEAILDHRLPPGTKLKELALAEVFGVTRGVIRKVLARLSHGKLIVLRPNRGAVVASPSIEESRDLFAARRAIEGAIVEALVKSGTRAQLRELRALIRNESEAYRRGEFRRGLKLSVEFHRTLAQMAGNTVLAEFLDELVSRTPLVILAHGGGNAGASCSMDEHSAMVDAIESADPGRAVAAMNTHLSSLERQLRLEEVEKPADLAELFGITRR